MREPETPSTAADAEKRRPDPNHGRRLLMIVLVGALAAGMAVFALRDPQAAMDALVPGGDKAASPGPTGTKAADSDQGQAPPSVFVSPQAVGSTPATPGVGAAQPGTSWEAEVLSGRRSLEQLLIEGDTLRVDITTQVLESERFAELQEHLQATAGNSPLAKDYEALAEAGAIDTFKNTGRVRFECSEQLCLMSATATDPDMDFNGWLARFQESTGTLGRVYSSDRRPLPGGGHEFRVVMSVDPKVDTAGTAPGG